MLYVLNVMHSIYKFEECVKEHNGKKESMRCTYIQFPDHPCASKTTNCNTLLLKWINVKGKSKLVPKKTFLASYSFWKDL